MSKITYGYEPWAITVRHDGTAWLATRQEPGAPHVCAKGRTRGAALLALAQDLTRPMVLDPSDPLTALVRWPASWPREHSLREEIRHHGTELAGSGPAPGEPPQ